MKNDPGLNISKNELIACISATTENICTPVLREKPKRKNQLPTGCSQLAKIKFFKKSYVFIWKKTGGVCKI